MSRIHITTLALMASICTLATNAMDNDKSIKSQSRYAQPQKIQENKPIYQMSMKELDHKLENATTEEEIDIIAAQMMDNLAPLHDLLQALLATFHSREDERFLKRAHAEQRPIHNFIPGAHNVFEESLKGFEGDFGKMETEEREKMIKDYREKRAEQMKDSPELFYSPNVLSIQQLEAGLRLIHQLMTEIEKMRGFKIDLLNQGNPHDIKSQNYDIEKRKIFIQNKADLRDKIAAFERQFGHGSKFSEQSMGSGNENPVDEEFLNKVDLNKCPDAQVVGKKVSTLFPIFSIEKWKSAKDSGSMRNISRARIDQIRLQNQLWSVYPGGKGDFTPYHAPMGQWDPVQMMMVYPPNTLMTFLPRTRLTAKHCEYMFEVVIQHNPMAGGMPGPLGHHWGPLKATFSLVFIPADEYVSPNQEFNAVQDQLEEEIEGENLDFKDKMTGEKKNAIVDKYDAEGSRAAVNAEIRQRMARMNFNEERLHRLSRIQQGEQTENPYMQPSDIKAQTYGRVHTPDYRYGRTYHRLYDIELARAASENEMNQAREDLEREEFEQGNAKVGIGTGAAHQSLEEEENMPELSSQVEKRPQLVIETEEEYIPSKEEKRRMKEQEKQLRESQQQQDKPKFIGKGKDPIDK